MLEVNYPEDEIIEGAPPAAEIPPAPARESVDARPKVASGKRKPKIIDDAPDDSDPEDADKHVTGKKLSKPLQEAKNIEDKSIKEILDLLGTDGAYKLAVRRQEPKQVRDPMTGKMLKADGHLHTYSETIEDPHEFIKERHGGGSYHLTVKKRSDRGSFDIFAHRNIEIAGDPNFDEIRGVQPLVGAPAAQVSSQDGESPKIVDRVLSSLEGQLKDARESRGRSADDPVFLMMSKQLEQAQQQVAELSREMREFATRPPPVSSEDKLKDKLLDKMIDQDTARLQAVRAQYESEIRMLKEQAIANENRIRDQLRLDMQDLKNAHEREFALTRQSYETSMSASKSSHEVSLSAATTSHASQKEFLLSENRKLERDNTELRTEVRELRAKKDKGILEMAKEIESVKDVLNLGDDEPKGIGEKMLDVFTNPEAIPAMVSAFRGQAAAAAAPAAAPAPVQQRPRRPQVVRDKETGQRFVMTPDGQKVPARRRGAEGEGSAPGDDNLPHLAPEMIDSVVNYLERAYAGGQEPKIVAQSGRAMVPEQILSAIATVGGVDVFLAKVAKLPGSSPLVSSQKGRNWIREVGKELVGM